MPSIVPLFGIAPVYRPDELLITQGRIASWEEEGHDDLTRGVMRVPCFWNDGEAFKCLTSRTKCYIDEAMFRIRWQVQSRRRYSRILYTTDLVSPNTFTTRQDVGKDVQEYIVSELMKLDEKSDGILNVFPSYLGYFEEVGYSGYVTIPCYMKDGTSYTHLDDYLKSHIDAALLRITSMLDSGRYRKAIWHGNKPVDGQHCYIPSDVKNYIVSQLLSIGKRPSISCESQGWWYGH